ncbi:uncharacterized protein LOC117652786 isoform X2 [Thrips palmi]|uniref:Uncharacterized protein LOC117652786 isoform X2 n=1 Tax=Thrips palmi TaxID=161013 RepID=A0A6P9A740_THRPL|nr:uncharacterized protein LOC117652786 isoform X2 [Thrips palmi]
MRRISATFLAPTSLALTAVECGSGPLGRRDTCRGIRVATMADGYANDNFQAEPGYNLRILVEPQPFYRLRYATEMKSFHGALKGSGAPYPMVKLEQTHLMEETETFIRVSVFTASGEPHVHQIALKGPGATAWRLGKHADINLTQCHCVNLCLR